MIEKVCIFFIFRLLDPPVGVFVDVHVVSVSSSVNFNKLVFFKNLYYTNWNQTW